MGTTRGEGEVKEGDPEDVRGEHSGEGGEASRAHYPDPKVGQYRRYCSHVRWLLS